jgi:DNA-binding NtrC family response regulator
MVENELHILVVVDDSDDLKSVLRSTEAGMDGVRFTVVRTLEAARAALNGCPPDLVIADLRLPDGEGTDLLPSDGAERSFPLILLTGRGDEAAADMAIVRGALDYAFKDGKRFSDLSRTVRRSLREWKAIRARREAEQQLQQTEKRNQFLARVIERSAHPFAVGYIDGRLGIVNDAFCKLVGYTADELCQASWNHDLTPLE